MSRVPLASRVCAEAKRLCASGKVYYGYSDEFSRREEARGRRSLTEVLRQEFSLSTQRLTQLLFAGNFDVKGAREWARTENQLTRQCVESK